MSKYYSILCFRRWKLVGENSQYSSGRGILGFIYSGLTNTRHTTLRQDLLSRKQHTNCKYYYWQPSIRVEATHQLSKETDLLNFKLEWKINKNQNTFYKQFHFISVGFRTIIWKNCFFQDENSTKTYLRVNIQHFHTSR